MFDVFCTPENSRSPTAVECRIVADYRPMRLAVTGPSPQLRRSEKMKSKVGCAGWLDYCSTGHYLGADGAASLHGTLIAFSEQILEGHVLLGVQQPLSRP
jgi:hypothetical protein